VEIKGLGVRLYAKNDTLPCLIVLAQTFIVHGIKIVLVTIQTDYLDEGFSKQGSCLKLGS